MTIPQTTEGEETWPKDTSNLTARTTTTVQQATQACPQIGMDTGERKNAQPANVKVTTQETAEPNRTMNHCNNTCRLAPCRSSTPRYTGNYHPHPSPCTGDNHTVKQVEPHFTIRPSPMPTNQGAGNLELSQMLQTILCKNNEEANLKQQQKNLMANIPTFDRKDKKVCLMWVNHVEHTAKQARMTFREAVTSKA